MHDIGVWMTSNRALFTLLVFVGVLLAREIGIRVIRRSTDVLSAGHRRRISLIHHSSVLLLIGFVILFWASQIQDFALSITAIAVALVIATKELLLCLLGTTLVRTAGAFTIGDWIRVQGQFGEVIVRNLLSTEVQEIEPHGFTYTGRTVIFPNSLFLSSSVVNQNFLRRYQFHSFQMTIEPDAFPIDAEEKLADRITALTEPFAETARRYAAVLRKRTGIDIPDPEPVVEFSTNELAKIVTTITVFCPTDRIGSLEKEMVREFFAWYRSGRKREDADRAGGRDEVNEERDGRGGRGGEG